MRRVAAAALCAALCITAVAHASTSTKLKFGYFTGASWLVEVKSPKTSCKDNRKVTVYRKVSGDDEKRGSSKSFPGKGDSYVALIDDTDPPDGTYYAKTDAKGNCAGAKSRNYEHPPN